MPKDIVQVEIKRIPLDIEIKGLGYVEIADLASTVEKKMNELQAEGVFDTLSQALMAALYFAGEVYLKEQSAGGKRKEEEARLEDLLLKFKSAVDSCAK